MQVSIDSPQVSARNVNARNENMIPGNYKERLVGTETFKCSRTIQVLRILFVLLNFYETCINHELSGTMKPIV